MSRARRAARDLVDVAALAYILLALGLLVCATAPALVGWRANVIVSGSMAPALPAGTVVLTSSADPAAVSRGRVVLVDDPAAPGRRYVHRVVGRDRQGNLLTRGDALAARDPRPVPPAALHGVVRLAVPLVGRPAVWVQRHRPLPLVLWGLPTLAALALVAGRGRSLQQQRVHALAALGDQLHAGR